MTKQQTPDHTPIRGTALRRAIAAMGLVAALLCGSLLAGMPASAAVIGTGAVSIKGPSSELIPGTTVEIRENNCTGAPVWRTTTGRTSNAFGAFGIGLAPGVYCVVTLAAPAPYAVAANVMFTMQARAGNWVTVWLPGPISGALVAKDSIGAGIDGVTAFIREGDCLGGGAGVWQNTTATGPWSSGGFGISLLPGRYCVTALSVPAGYEYPQPQQVDVAGPAPIWITMWVADALRYGDDVIPVDFLSASQLLDFSCAACTGNVIVTAEGPDGASDLLVNEVGPYASGRFLVGFADYFEEHYTSISVQAEGGWVVRVRDFSAMRQVNTSAQGTGDDVVYFSGSGSVADLSNQGDSNFVVYSTDPFYGVDLIANEIGTYSGTVPVQSPAIMTVKSNGTWQINVR